MRLLSIVGRCGRWLCRLRRLRDYQTLHTIKIHGAPDAALLPVWRLAWVAERPSFGFLANLKPVDGLEQ
jgi:hypothetical protein